MFDVAIVGARCGGAALAAFLGKMNYKVLLVDRYERPGPVLSTHIIGESDVYGRLGILELMESSGAPSISRMRVDLNGHMFESDIIVTSRVLGLRRELLDPMLLEAADGPSVDIRLGMTASRVLWDQDRVSGLVLKDRKGAEETVKAKIIVGADGRHSTISNQVQAPVLRHASYTHAVLYFYAEGMEPQTVPTVEWYWHDHAIVIINPIDNGRYCIAVMLPQERIQAWGKDPMPALMEWLRTIRMLGPRLLYIKPDGRIRIVRDIEGYIKKSYGPGWALVGDACAHLHPVAGVGIDNAVCCAEYLAASLDNFLSGREEWDRAMSHYEGQLLERIGLQYEAALKTLSRALVPLEPDEQSSLGMLCTFPSLVHLLAQSARRTCTALLEGDNAHDTLPE